MKPVKMIFATDENCVFGRTDNTLPFKCKADMNHFKEYTKGHILVMGANTFKSLPKKLEGRMNVVYASLSRGFDDITTLSGDKPDLFINSEMCSVSDIPTHLDHLVHEFDGDIIFIGGAGLLHETLKSGIVTEVSMTAIDGIHRGDTTCEDLLKMLDSLTDRGSPRFKSFTTYFKDGCTIVIYNFQG